MNNVVKGEYFDGIKLSDYELQHGYITYATLAKTFDTVLCNNIINNNLEYWELVNGNDYIEEDDYYIEPFQYYIISDSGYKILRNLTDEIIYYNEELDVYVWGVTHYGTGWDCVFTDIKIES